MPRKLKGETRKRRTSFGEYILLLLIGVFAFMTAGELHNRGIQHKWATAIMRTLVTFGIVVYLCRRMWTRWAFWVAIGICLAANTIVTLVFFQYVLYGVDRFSILFWYPVMLGEVFVFLIAVKRIHDKLTGTHESIKLSF
jgi:CDP-diglyceride synthetase